jgi:hypothetical protein
MNFGSPWCYGNLKSEQSMAFFHLTLQNVHTSIGPCADGASFEVNGPAAFPIDANVPSDNAEASLEACRKI